jgi:hypothetical protein
MATSLNQNMAVANRVMRKASQQSVKHFNMVRPNSTLSHKIYKKGKLVAIEYAKFVNENEIRVPDKVYRSMNSWAEANLRKHSDKLDRETFTINVYDRNSGIYFVRNTDDQRRPLYEIKELIAPAAPVAPAPSTSDVVASTLEAALETKKKEIQDLEKMAKEAIDKAEKKKKASILIEQVLEAIRA